MDYNYDDSSVEIEEIRDNTCVADNHKNEEVTNKNDDCTNEEIILSIENITIGQWVKVKYEEEYFLGKSP